MITFVLLIALQGISGGISGYITNKYAVNMLFKEYTPLKLGGVIKKKKEKFIEEISELVERYIINSETLKAEIATKDMSKYIEMIADSFFDKALENSIGNTKLSDISEFSSSITKSEDFIKRNINDIIPKLLEEIFTKIDLEEILTKDQISKIVDMGYDILLEQFEKNNNTYDFIYGMHKENSNRAISSIVSEETRQRLVKNINDHITNIIDENIFKDEKSCEIFFDKIINTINIDETLLKLQNVINDSRIDKFISKSEKEEISLTLYRKINELIENEKGRNFLMSLINELIAIGKDMDLTIYEIPPREMEENISDFIETLMPLVMPHISKWISDNKIYFNDMIKDSIDEAIGNMDESIKQLVISKVTSVFMGEDSSDNGIASKIKNYFNDDSCGKLHNMLIEYLKATKIKDIVNLIEKQKLFDSEKAVNIIGEQFKKNGKDILKAFINSRFSKNISSFVELDLIALFNSKFKPLIYTSIFKSKDRISEEINNIIKKFIFNKSEEVFNRSLSELVNDDKVHDLAKRSSEYFNKSLMDNKQFIKEKITNFMNLEVKKINLSTQEKYKVDISAYIVDKVMDLYRKTVDKNKERKLSEIVKVYLKKEQLTNILMDEGYPLLVSKLPQLLDGKIKKFAKSNLSKYNEDEICDMVQDFMGNQLKPLSVFGAVLGTVVGVAYQLIFPNSIGAYGFPGSAVNTLMSCGIMAGIGYITNVIALWMIFHPYKENKVVSKIPFFKKFALGYIPAHKNQFAIGMAKLIDEELLNKEEINKSFDLHKDDMKSVLMNLVQNNNYQLLVNFVKSKKQLLEKAVYTKILKYCSSDNGLSKNISNHIGKSKVDKLINKHQIISLVPKLINSLENAQSKIVEYAKRKLENKKTINEMLTKEMVVEIRKNTMSQIDNIVKEKINDVSSMEFARIVTLCFEKDYNLQINKSFKDFIGDESLSKLKNNLGMKIYYYIFNDLKDEVPRRLKTFLCRELEGEKNIASLFDGKIKNAIDDNITVLTEKIFGKALLYLKDNQDELAPIVQDSIKGNLNFFEKIAYSSFGGDDIAYRALEIMLNKKLPMMIETDMDKCISLASMVLNDSIYPMKVSEVKIKVDDIAINRLVDEMFIKLNRSVNLREYISALSSITSEGIISEPIITYFELCNLHKLELVHKKFNYEAQIVKEDLFNNIKEKSDELSHLVKEFLDEKLIEPLFNLDVLEIVTFEDIDESIKNILQLVINSAETKKQFKDVLDNIYDNVLTKLSVDKIIDKDRLNIDIKNAVNKIVDDTEFTKKAINFISDIIQNLIDNNLGFITDDSKNYFIDKTIQTGLTSINDNIVLILQEINIKNITNKQIELLNPKEIDILFNSFAGDFFTKLRIYGVFGFVFGINVWLSIVLLAIDSQYSRIQNEG